jgi:hypothetical protein
MRLSRNLLGNTGWERNSIDSFNINVYIPRSEYEVSADSYVDLYLQAAFKPKRSAHYFIELKYAKAKASKQTQDKKEQEGVEAMRKYLQTDSAKRISNLQAYALMFRKDKYVRKIRYSVIDNAPES